MIRFEKVSFTYPGAPRPVLHQVDLVFGSGQLALVIGPTGAGKSTLLKTVNGLVPHFTGGVLSGRVTVGGRATSTHPPRRLAGLVGYVGQDPATSFVTDRVVDELSYTMEQQGTEPPVMRARVEEILDLLGIADLRDRDPAGLSAGQAQRVAIGAALTAHPKVLVLDEPTSALDPAAAEDVMAAIARLVDDLDLTVLMAEHRLERVIQFADCIVRIDGDGSVNAGEPSDQLSSSPVAPPLIRLARALDWPQIPLTVREARRMVHSWPALGATSHRSADTVRSPTQPDVASAGRPGLSPHQAPSERAAAHLPPPAASRSGRRSEDGSASGAGAGDGSASGAGASTGAGAGAGSSTGAGSTVLRAVGISVTHPGPIEAVKNVSVELPGGCVTGLMGRNGAGKTSLLWALAQDHHGRPRPDVVMVPAQPTDLFWSDSVAGELPNAEAGTLLEQLAPAIARTAHPRDLSEGQRLALALAIQLTATTRVVILDEPTRGLDYGAKDRLAALLKSLAAQDRAVLVATHDVEFLALVAGRIIWMAEGEVVGDGPAADFLVSVPAHAPQIAKVMAPLRCLTVADALSTLNSRSRSANGGEPAGPAEPDQNGTQ